MMITPGIVSATFREKTAEEVIALCKAAGLEAVEWSENAHINPGDIERAEKLHKQTINAGLQIAASGSYFRLGQNEDAEEAFRISAITAEAIHAPVIRIWAGTKASADASPEYREKLVKETRKICEVAKGYQLKVALEWHKNTLTDTNESAMEFLKAVDHENLYCLWQPTVALSMEERIKGLDLLGTKLLNLHIYYWPNGTRRPLSEGMDVWKTYLSHVNQQQDRFGLLEFVMGNTEAQFLEDAQILKNLLKQ